MDIENGESEGPDERERFVSADSYIVRITDDFDENYVRKREQERILSKDHIKKLMDKWREVARRVHKEYVDPWDHLNIQNYPIQRARRYRYSAIRNSWSEDLVEVRIHPEPFARGAMRECYRMKKLSSLCGNQDWSMAQNYVAKKYINQVDRKVLFDDVRLQMDAKLWAEEYNRYNPPKKIDIVQMCLIELIDADGSPLYHVEHFIEGKYLKYNSNSGFVSNDARFTPQAFSHFTFERSGHQMMVVDIQGVGDLYTDPQIHTVVGTDYGDGNLGTRGMALFFHSHRCNYICESMELSSFELSPPEIAAAEKPMKQRAKSLEMTMFESRRSRLSSECMTVEHGISMENLRRRNTLAHSESDLSNRHNDDCICPDCIPMVDTLEEPITDDEDDEEYDDNNRLNGSKSRLSRLSYSTKSSGDESFGVRRQKVGFYDMRSIRQRHDSFLSSVGTYSMNSSRITKDTERDDYWKASRKKSIPANSGEMELRGESYSSNNFTILGQVHIDLARYHELGRFVDVDPSDRKTMLDSDTDERNDEPSIIYDKQSAIFHLDIARKCGILEAILTTAHIVLGLPHELLKDVTVDDLFPSGITNANGAIQDVIEFGTDLIEIAAEMGDKGAMLYMAHSYETGQRLGANRNTDYKRAIEWYQRVLGFQEEETDEEREKSDTFDTFSPLTRYEILAKMAEMYKEGGYNLNQDFERAHNLFTEAAEAAMEDLKGKLANKYYEKAEMCGEY